MLEITKEELYKIKGGFYGKRIAVVGDMMLDCYFWGDVKRISPEAPVPVVEVDEEFYRFGGAANVANNILQLGGVPIPIGVIGKDNDGKIFNSLIKDAGITSDGIIIDEDRPTTAKTRVIANNQHAVRIDKESKSYINSAIEKKVLDFFSSNISSFDAIIMQDYNKGVLTKFLIKKLVKLSRLKDKIITVDPKFDNFFEFSGATVFKPNRKECEDVFGVKIKSDEDVSKAGEKLLERIKSIFVLLTLGEHGIALFEDGKPEKRISTKARHIADVSGAGDTVISTLTIALTAGADIFESAYLANYAGGIVCEEVGIVPIEVDKLFNTVESQIK